MGTGLDLGGQGAGLLGRQFGLQAGRQGVGAGEWLGAGGAFAHLYYG